MNLKQYKEKNKKTIEDPHLNQILFAHGDSRSGVDLKVQKETVDREKIVEGADNLVQKIQPGMILQFMYHGEVGHGLGPTLEFYNLLATDLKKQQFEIGQNKQMASIWRSGVPHRGLFPREIDPQMTDRETLKKVCRIFHVTGTFVAKSILDNRLMEMPFSPLMWDLIFAKKVNIFSLKAIDPSLYQYFRELQKIANRKVEIEEDSKLDEQTRQNMLKEQQQMVGDMDLAFYSPCNPEIELVKGGNDIKVTVDNLQEYIDLVVHNIFYDTINLQIDAFKQGFNQLLPIEALRTFSTGQQLELLVCGQDNEVDAPEWRDADFLKTVITPDQGYTQTSSQYHNFVRYITELDPNDRKVFLNWVTGSNRLPAGGFAALNPKMTLNRKRENKHLEKPDAGLPTVNTCKHYVKMPEYTSYEQLKERFDLATKEDDHHFDLN